MIPFLDEMLKGFPDISRISSKRVVIENADCNLPAWFDVSGLAAASVASTGLMLGHYLAGHAGGDAPVVVDKRLATLWFGMTLRPHAWKTPPVWDDIAGDYLSKDGWIRLHTNAPKHREAALRVLGDCYDQKAVAKVVKGWSGLELETAIVEEGGCAALMRDMDAWSDHEQGKASWEDPLILWEEHDAGEIASKSVNEGRPLSGVKVLDLTRILAGPVAGRFLAAYGADVLRIDPPWWEEPVAEPELTLGKRCAGLALRQKKDRKKFEALLSKADVFLHGYRADALEKLGYGADKIRDMNPGLVDVSLNAYGWSGPWCERRGFDSLVQMSSGIASYGMTASKEDRPTPLPVQALDHATGYLMAAAILYGLAERRQSGKTYTARLSLARTAHLLVGSQRSRLGVFFREESADDLDPKMEDTAWGPAQRVKFPLSFGEIKAGWDYPAGKLKSSKPKWKSAD